MMLFKIYSAFQRFGYEGVGTVRMLFEQASREGWNTKTLQTKLSVRGLGYRRQDMLEDFRAYKAVSRAPDWKDSAQLNAFKKFYNQIEPYRKARGITLEKAYEEYNKWERGEYESAEEAELIEDYASDYDWETTP